MVVCQLSARPGESEGAFDINAFKRGSGATPQVKKNLKFFFIFYYCYYPK